MNIPEPHIHESLKLEAGREVTLFELEIPKTGSTLYFWNGQEITWQGANYEQLPCSMSGVKTSADGEANRPKMQFYNKENIFGPMIEAGYLDRAILYERTILQENLFANANIAMTRIWMLGRCLASNRRMAIFQLRTLSDFPNFKTPTNAFVPPKYPFVVY